MGDLPDEAMARCSKNQVLDSSMSSVFCDGLRDVCILEHHIKTWYLQVSPRHRRKGRKQRSKQNNSINSTYIFASTEAMEGEEEIFSRLFKSYIAAITYSVDASKCVVVACIQIIKYQ